MKITVSINTLVEVDGKKVPHPINEISLEVRMKTTIRELKAQIFNKTQIPVSSQVLETSGILLDQDNLTLANCLIRDGDVVTLTLEENTLGSTNAGQLPFESKPDVDLGGVMGDIVEHDDDDLDIIDFNSFSVAGDNVAASMPEEKRFFPEAPSLFTKDKSEDKPSFGNQKEDVCMCECDSCEGSDNEEENGEDFDKMMAEIKAENAKKIQSMSQEEIDNALKEIYSEIPADVIEAMKKKAMAEMSQEETKKQPPKMAKTKECHCKCCECCKCCEHEDEEDEEDFDKMMAEIKAENAKKIQSMSQEEIDNALKEIYSEIPADVIEAMKKKAMAEMSQEEAKKQPPKMIETKECHCKCCEQCCKHEDEEDEEDEEDFDKMMAEIKAENAKKIQSMSQEEIDNALKEIYSEIPADVIEIMKKKAMAEMSQETPKKQPTKTQRRTRESASSKDGKGKGDAAMIPGDSDKVKAANKVLNVLDAIHERDSIIARRTPNPLAEWNTDAEPPAVIPDVREVETADIRFGFDGAIIPPGTDIPTSAGLHHHGGDQWAAGYTINELCTLTRSSFPSQRVEALHILSNILKKAQTRQYDRTDVRVVMVQKYRLPYLIRISMDDKQVSVVSAAVKALHALVVDPREIELERIMESCYRGEEHQDYTVYTRKDSAATADENDTEQYVPDEDYASFDLVNGLIALGVAERLRYLLQVAALNGLEVAIVEIIDRLARHSAVTCAKLVETPFMVSALVERVVDLQSNPSLARVSAQALRHLCQSTPECCSKVISNEMFAKSFSKYFEDTERVAVLPEQIGVQEEVLAIYRAAARFGCLAPGVPKIPTDFVGPIPATLSFLSACCKAKGPYDEVAQGYALKSAHILNSFAEMRGAKLSVVDLKTLSAVLHFLAIFVGNPSNSEICETSLFAPLMRFLNSPYMSLITLEVFKKLRFDESKVDLLFFYRSLIDGGLPSVIDGRKDDTSIDSDESNSLAYDAKDYVDFAIHCLSGSVVSGLFFSFSNIIDTCTSKDFLTRVQYALDEKTPVLISISASIPPASPLNKLSPCLNALYLQRPLVHAKVSVNALLYRLGVDPMKYYNSVLWTVGDLFSGDEAYLGELLTILFDDEAMSILASKEPIVDPKSRIESVRNAYISLISRAAGDARLNASFGLVEKGTARVRNLFITRDWYLFPLGRDWPTVCLKWRITLAGAAQKSGSEPVSDKNSSTWALQYLYWLILNRQFNFIPYVGDSLWFHRCMCFFLLDEFDSYKSTLDKLFTALMSSESDVTPAGVAAAGGSSYPSLVCEVLTKYGNESFGDPTFTQYIGFLALAYGPANIRFSVWKEVPYLFHFLGGLVYSPWGIDAYLWPAERDESVLDAMKRALASGDISKSRTGLFYWVAVHHIACSLFGLCGVPTPMTTFSKRVMLEALSQKLQALVDVVEYEPPPPLATYKANARKYKGKAFDFVGFFEAKEPKNSLFSVNHTNIAHAERLSDLDPKFLESLFDKKGF